jgi:hypothetical protein
MGEKMGVVTCKLQGPGAANFGLANQMFGVATTLSYAKDADQIALFPCLSNKQEYGNYCENIFRKLHLEAPQAPVEHFFQEPQFRYTEIPAASNIALSGYFQSEKYFKHNRELILDSFALPPDVENYIAMKYSRLLYMENTVAVHVRRGDYTNIFKGCFEVLGKEYYERAFSHFPSDSVFVFFSDMDSAEHADYCKENFSVRKAFHVHGETDVVDLFLMSKMKNNIIANSSFSWWGAWLNTNPDKKVIAPQKWFAPTHPNLGDSDEVTRDLIPEEWERI